MKKLISIVLFSIVSFASTLSFGQTPQQWTYMLQLKGHWTSNAALILGAQTFNINYSMHFKSDNGGTAMTMDEGFSDPNLGQLTGANLIGLNSADGLIHWFSVDNFGTAHEHIGAFTNSKHLYIEHSSIQGGLPYVERINATLNTNNKKFTLSLIATLGPDTVEQVYGVFSKGGSAHRTANVTETGEEEFNVFPNPSTGEFKITNAKEISEIRITNEAGRVVYTANPNNRECSFRLEAKGEYFLTVYADGKSLTKKILAAE